MKIILHTILALLFPLVASAQISVESFEQLNDVDARVNFPVIDFDGNLCALIKIATTEKSLSFDAGQLPVVKTDSKHAGEIWVYVPEGTMKLKISHEKFGGLKGRDVHGDGFYYFPTNRLKRATSYRMVLAFENSNKSAPSVEAKKETVREETVREDNPITKSEEQKGGKTNTDYFIVHGFNTREAELYIDGKYCGALYGGNDGEIRIEGKKGTKCKVMVVYPKNAFVEHGRRKKITVEFGKHHFVATFPSTIEAYQSNRPSSLFSK